MSPRDNEFTTWRVRRLAGGFVALVLVCTGSAASGSDARVDRLRERAEGVGLTPEQTVELARVREHYEPEIEVLRGELALVRDHARALRRAGRGEAAELAHAHALYQELRVSLTEVVRAFETDVHALLTAEQRARLARDTASAGRADHARPERAPVDEGQRRPDRGNR